MTRQHATEADAVMTAPARARRTVESLMDASVAVSVPGPDRRTACGSTSIVPSRQGGCDHHRASQGELAPTSPGRVRAEGSFPSTASQHYQVDGRTMPRNPLICNGFRGIGLDGGYESVDDCRSCDPRRVARPQQALCAAPWVVAAVACRPPLALL